MSTRIRHRGRHSRSDAVREGYSLHSKPGLRAGIVVDQAEVATDWPTCWSVNRNPVSEGSRGLPIGQPSHLAPARHECASPATHGERHWDCFVTLPRIAFR